jgi:hypothetical protein
MVPKKSRKWVERGDSNTQKIHRRVIQQKSYNMIWKINDQSGNKTRSFIGIYDEAVNFLPSSIRNLGKKSLETS